MAIARDAIVVLGEVVDSYGVRGWLKVRPYTEHPETLLGYATWWLKPPRGGEWREVARFEGRLHSGVLVVALDGTDNREEALAMKGAAVGVPRSALPAAKGDELYWDDLTGLAVVNRAGTSLGVVAGMTEHGAHPLLRVARPSGAAGPERLIPFVAAIVDRVDVAAGRIDVDWGEDY
ncbi:MAG: ribosome maturation factor RimM [Betaproteobacteria bacterium]